jgi:hypothetical protein
MADDTLTSTLTDSQAAQSLPVAQPQIPQQAPDLPRFQRTFGNTLKSMLIGLGEGGVLGAAFGAANPAAIERQQQQRQQAISIQTAEAVAKAHVAQINAAALPGKLRDEHDKAVDEHVKFMTDTFGPPDEVIPNTSEAAQAALQNHLGNGNVPLAHIATNSDSIFAWHAGAGSANSANLDIVHQAGILSGNPVFRNMTSQQYGALKPAEREQLFVKAGGILAPVTPDPDPVARARQLLDAQRQLQTVQSLPGGRQRDQLLTLAQNNMDFLNKADKAYADAGITSATQKGQQAGAEAVAAQPGKTQAQLKGEAAEAATPAGQLATAQKQATLAETKARTAEAQATTEKTRAEIAANPIYAVTKDGQTVQTTPAEAKANGYTNPVKVTEAQLDKDRFANATMGDVQVNLSRYKQALDNLPANFNPTRIATVINEGGLELGAHAGGLGFQLPTDWLNKLTTSQNWATLSGPEQDAVIAYYRAKGAVPAFVRAVTGSGRANRETMEVEMANMPNPTMPKAIAQKQLGAFQENVTQRSKSIPKLVGVESQQEIKNRVEAEAPPVQTPAPKAAQGGPAPTGRNARKSNLERLLDQLEGK